MTILVLSGAKGEDEPCPEAEAMEQYLLGQGAAAEQLLLEEQSFSTVENRAYSKLLIENREQKLLQEQKRKTEAEKLLRAPGEPELQKNGKGAQEEISARPVRIGVLTSNFHLCRAGMIAKKQHYDMIYGIASEADKVLLVHFSLRDGIYESV